MSFFNFVRFTKTSDKKFSKTFMNIIDLSPKDNTYKFAIARFLLEYSKHHTITHVSYETIAKYFLKYYWTHECKSKFKQAPQATKQPEILKIIQSIFGRKYYPQTFDEIGKIESEKIQTCINKIVIKCFHNVIWRFQRIKNGTKSQERKIFFDYTIDRIVNENKKYIKLKDGIYLNPDAITFLKNYNVPLYKSVILGWSKFIENINVGVPKIILKTEGTLPQRKSLSKIKENLKSHKYHNNCFYCNVNLTDDNINVEHVIPFDYIAEDNIWNLVLACKQCNCNKLGSLPPKEYINKLIIRNKEYRKKISRLGRSISILEEMGQVKKIIMNHYENAQLSGYPVISKQKIISKMNFAK